MVVVVLLAVGSCAAFVSRELVRELNASGRRTALGSLEAVAAALRLYRGRVGHFPLTSPVADALVESRILDVVPKDLWGRPLAIEPIDGGLRITSFGADGKPGGTNDDADLVLDVTGP